MKLESGAAKSTNSLLVDVDKVLSAFGCSAATDLAQKLIKGEISREAFVNGLKGVQFGGGDGDAMEIDN